MSKRYASFLLRWWQHGANGEMVEVEQIQTGERVLLGSLDAACDWIAAHGAVSARTKSSKPRSRRVAGSVDAPPPFPVTARPVPPPTPSEREPVA